MATASRRNPSPSIPGKMGSATDRRRQPNLTIGLMLMDDKLTTLLEIDGEDATLQLDVSSVADRILELIEQTAEQGVGEAGKAALIKFRHKHPNRAHGYRCNRIASITNPTTIR